MIIDEQIESIWTSSTRVSKVTGFSTVAICLVSPVDDWVQDSLNLYSFRFLCRANEEMRD